MTRGPALANLLLGIGNLLLVGYSIARYEPPNNGGESIIGLFWVIYMILGGMVMANGGIAALFLRRVRAIRWPHRLVTVGAGAGSIAGL